MARERPWHAHMDETVKLTTAELKFKIDRRAPLQWGEEMVCGVCLDVDGREERVPSPGKSERLGV